MLPDSKGTELRSSDQEASPSGRQKYLGSFSAMSPMEVCSYSYYRCCECFRGPRVSFVMTDEFSLWFTKVTSRVGVS